MTTILDSDATTATPDDAPTKGTKLLRYVVVTLIASPGNLALYGLLLANTAWPAVVANLTAATVVSGPTYILHRRWVWARRDSHSVRADIAPYWATTLTNVGLSSTTAAVLDRAGASDDVLVGATFAVYTALWLGRFLFLDVVFRDG